MDFGAHIGPWDPFGCNAQTRFKLLGFNPRDCRPAPSSGAPFGLRRWRSSNTWG